MMRESRGAEAVHHRQPERQRISKGGLILSSYPVTNLAPDIWNLLRSRTTEAAYEQCVALTNTAFCQWIMKRGTYYRPPLPPINYGPVRKRLAEAVRKKKEERIRRRLRFDFCFSNRRSQNDGVKMNKGWTQKLFCSFLNLLSHDGALAFETCKDSYKPTNYWISLKMTAIFRFEDRWRTAWPIFSGSNVKSDHTVRALEDRSVPSAGCYPGAIWKATGIIHWTVLPHPTYLLFTHRPNLQREFHVVSVADLPMLSCPPLILKTGTEVIFWGVCSFYVK